MVVPIAWLLLTAAGLYYVTSRPGGNATRTSGIVQLQAGVPYRFEVVLPRVFIDSGTPPPFPTADQQHQMLQALTSQGALNASITETSLGLEIAYQLTPPVTTAVSIGAPVFPLMGKTRLRAITRLDGRPF